MLTQSQSVAQQSPPPDKKKRKFLSDGFRALSAGLIRFCQQLCCLNRSAPGLIRNKMADRALASIPSVGRIIRATAALGQLAGFELCSVETT
jgi:hypothetical protein